MRSVDWRLPGLFACLALVLLLSGINLGAGISGDLDGHFVFARAQAYGVDGLTPSRGWGYPAYEALAYPLIYHLGPLAGKLYSLSLLLGALALFFFVAASVGGDWRSATLATLALAVVPVVIISGNTLMETSQGLFLTVLALSLAASYLREPRAGRLLWLAVTLGLATATRLDYVLLAAAIGLLVLLDARLRLWWAVGGLLCYVAAGLLPYGLYLQARGATVVLPDPFWHRLGRAAVGWFQLPGPAAWAVLGLGLLNVRPLPHRQRRPWTLLLLTSAILYGVRFVMLPDELEYLLPLLPLGLLWLVQRGWSTPWWVALILALALPNVLQFHMLAADARGDRYLAPGVSPGAIYQDRSARLRWQHVYRALPEQFDAIAQQHGADTYATLPSEEPGMLVIIPRDQTRFYRPERQGGRFWRVACQQTIVTYPLPSDRGWRQLTRYQAWRPVTVADFELFVPPGCDANR